MSQWRPGLPRQMLGLVAGLQLLALALLLLEPRFSFATSLASAGAWLLLCLLGWWRWFRSKRPLALRLLPASGWQIESAAGHWQDAELLGHSLLWPALLVLHFQTADGVRWPALVIDRSALDEAAWRGLQLALRTCQLAVDPGQSERGR